VSYKLPLGALGNLVAGGFVKKQLFEIFRFREEVLAKRFPELAVPV